MPSSNTRFRWIIASLFLLVLGAGAVTAIIAASGSFVTIRFPAPAEAKLREIGQKRGWTASALLRHIVASDEQSLKEWQDSSRRGDLRAITQMQQQGKVWYVASGTRAWYRPSPDYGEATRVRLLGSKYAGREGWVSTSLIRPG